MPADQSPPLDCTIIIGGDTCSRYRLPDGTLVDYAHIPSGPEDTATKNRKNQTSFLIIRPDGTRIGILASNGRAADAGPDRADLPLTAQQLWSIAADPRLGALMDPAFVETSNKMVPLDAAPY
jgi:hypothetical protein